MELLVDDTVVEIWDVGGDHKSAQSMMPAFSQPCESRNGKRTCDGYLLVYSPDRLEDREELLNWYKSFADLSSNWQDKECAVFAVGRKNKDVVELKLTEPLPQCTHHNITLENGSEIRGYFRTFITTIQNTACS